ncbi:glucose-1-phosphate adenylyltransferase [bacterium]|nr:glucose-1-phosphate adenylyltransferase [bacterium]MBU1650911.1 glucose-1-phosphate adenylyltransferase [bacterium]MBU1880612.1 glucose-1-phosphate adenylyltransferase [bacterium]
MSSMLAIILGGGQGGRLYPLTKHRSKPAVPIAGKYRLIDIPVSNCIHSRIERIFVLTQFNSASLNRHVNLTYKFDAFHEGFVDILAAEQTMDNTDWFQGTADAVRKTLRHFQRFSPENYLILAGDHLYKMDYRQMMETHEESGADITVAVSPVTYEEADQLGILHVDDAGEILNFVEKPKEDSILFGYEIGALLRSKYDVTDESRCLLGSMGVYIFKRDILKKMLQNFDHTDFGKHIIPQGIGEFKVHAHVFTGYWRDVGTITSFYDSNMDLLSRQPNYHFFDEPFRVFTRARYLPGSKISGLQSERAIICEGSMIEEAALKNALVGLRTIIRKGATVEDSYIMGGDFYEDDPELDLPPVDGVPRIGIGQDSHIVGAIVDKNARIGRGVKITQKAPDENYSGPGFMVKDGITVIEKDAVIPDGMEI